MSVCSSSMQAAAVRFMAGFSGALGVALLLLSLGTDYWLLASEGCESQGRITAKLTRIIPEEGLREESDAFEGKLLSYHEGIFWRCTYSKDLSREEESVLDFWITQQAAEKMCMPSYLAHVPLSGQANDNFSPDSATVHRAFWCVLAMLGLTLVMVGVFIIICGIPMASRRLYEAGGALFITGGLMQLAVVVLFAAWVQGSEALEFYALRRRLSTCASLRLAVHYGPSFMLAPAAAFFCVLCGLLVLHARPRRRAEDGATHSEPPPMQDQ